MLPLATSHELDPPTLNLSPEKALVAAEANFNLVLGHAMGNAEVARFDPENVWPTGLLVVEDYGCAIYRAIDLDSPQLCVIEHENLEPVDDPQAAVGPDAQLAYSEPTMPKAFQHQFVVIAPS